MLFPDPSIPSTTISAPGYGRLGTIDLLADEWLADGVSGKTVAMSERT